MLFGHYNKRCSQEIPKEDIISRYSVTGMGLKLRIHPLAAAIANQQLNEIGPILMGRKKIAKIIHDNLKDLPGIRIPILPSNIEPSWYALTINYYPAELGGLEIGQFYKALITEGCNELDMPGSTKPLNLHPLFQEPGVIFPDYNDKFNYKVGDFPNAEKFHKNLLKLPVWHKEEDIPLVYEYINAFKKVICNYREILKNTKD